MIPLPIISSNVLADATGHFAGTEVWTIDGALLTATLLSQAGIAEFFMAGEIDDLAERALQASHFLTETLRAHGDQGWGPACLDALLPALAFNESQLEPSLFAWVSAHFQAHGYYDADQGTCLLLLHLLKHTPLPDSVTTGLLADGSNDATQRMAIADAARSLDSPAFNIALAERMESLREELREKCESDEFTEEQQLTLAKLSFEGLAWIRAGERLALQIDDEFPLTPFSARAGQKTFAYEPESWREE